MESNIRITGAAGQGMQTAADLLGRALMRSGHHVYIHHDIESRIRGGVNFSQLRCATFGVHAPSNRVDILVSLQPESTSACIGALSFDGQLFCSHPMEHPQNAPFTLTDVAKESGNEKTISTVAAAVGACMLDLPLDILTGLLTERFGHSEPVLEANRKALQLAWERTTAAGLAGRWHFGAGEPAGRRMFLSGAASIALGAMAGGCTFMAAYPMSPATGIMTTLSEFTHEGGPWVEQAEDEIAAINMVAGASYAGARAMTATSGGGFALMTEGVSLLGMIECPAVIVIAQRPGPATGLPTRTAQGDLRLALHAGHGRFARAIFAPRTLSEAFSLTAEAFDIAEKFQIPVCVLSDQLLQDCQGTVSVPEVPSRVRSILSREEIAGLDKYERFALAEDGVSPMALPGDSRHLVVVDSDEHDTSGHLTEDPQISESMCLKRLRKINTVTRAARLPECTVFPAELPLILSWGSTSPIVEEAVAFINRERPLCNHLQFTQLWPLPDLHGIEAFARTRRMILVEASDGDGLDTLLAQTQLRVPDCIIGNLNGRPFTLEKLAARLLEEIHD